MSPIGVSLGPSCPSTQLAQSWGLCSLWAREATFLVLSNQDTHLSGQPATAGQMVWVCVGLGVSRAPGHLWGQQWGWGGPGSPLGPGLACPCTCVTFAPPGQPPTSGNGV